jgi:hypothetical protein
LAIEPHKANPKAPDVVWAEEAKPGNARTDPPRHAEQMAMAMYQRVARRKAGIERSRFGKTSLILAGVCVVLALALFPVDLPLLHIPSAVLSLVALVLGIKGLMGY